MKKNGILWMFALLMLSVGMSSCSSDENDDLSNGKSNETTSDAVSIVGTWELKTLCYPDGDVEVPSGQRDIFIFNSNGKVKVIKKRKSVFPDFPNEDGEYDFSYDKEKQTITFCGKTRECVITDSVMDVESGYYSDRGEPISNFIFQKCETQESVAHRMVYDFAPIEFQVFMTDNDGHDLLDPTYQNNLIKNLSVIYQGKIYPLQTEEEAYNNQVSTRVYASTFRGLVLRKYWSHLTFTYGEYEMVFGEFSGSENVDKLEITLNLPNNQQIRLAYSNDLKWTSNGEPEINRTFYYNDQALNDEGGKRGHYHLRYINYLSTYGVEYVPSEIK